MKDLDWLTRVRVAWRRTLAAGAVAALAWLAAQPPARAVILFGTGDPAVNTTEPTGALAGSGWQFEGDWIGFLGTAIAPQFFISARHIGGTVGDPFVFRGTAFTTTAVFDDADSDLRLWQICGALPEFAPLYRSADEVNQLAVVVGRGTQRGAPVVVGAVTKGWQWGAWDSVRRWGENQVAAIVDGNDPANGVTGVGPVLQLPFNANAGTNEATLSGGDSGGAVFIHQGNVWSLAGINYSVDGPYNTNTTGAGFLAAIFDEGGLYTGGEGKWAKVPDRPSDRPGSGYATRISAHLAWIDSVLASATVTVTTPVTQAAPAPEGPYADDPTAAVNVNTKTVTIPLASKSRFYRLRSCAPASITSVSASRGNLVLTYQ